MFTTRSNFTGRRGSTLSVVSLALALSACGGNTPSPQAKGDALIVPTTTVAKSPKVLTVGKHDTNLDFAVNAVTDGSSADSPFTTTSAPPAVPTGARTRVAAASEFVRNLVQQDVNSAWTLLDHSEQDRLGYRQRLADEVSAAGWKSFALRESRGDSVAFEIVQTPKVSDIDGVIATKALVTLRTVANGAGYSVVWSRRRVEQLYPERSENSDRKVGDAVLTWVRARQNCTAGPNEYSGGLLGVVGLATALCRTTETATIQGTGDLDSLDEPQPVIDSFGGSALLWARVVLLAGPVPMNVIVAPDGETWTIVGVARPSLATP